MAFVHTHLAYESLYVHLWEIYIQKMEYDIAYIFMHVKFQFVKLRLTLLNVCSRHPWVGPYETKVSYGLLMSSSNTITRFKTAHRVVWCGDKLAAGAVATRRATFAGRAHWRAWDRINVHKAPGAMLDQRFRLRFVLSNIRLNMVTKPNSNIQVYVSVYKLIHILYVIVYSYAAVLSNKRPAGPVLAILKYFYLSISTLNTFLSI